MKCLGITVEQEDRPINIKIKDTKLSLTTEEARTLLRALQRVLNVEPPLWAHGSTPNYPWNRPPSCSN